MFFCCRKNNLFFIIKKFFKTIKNAAKEINPALQNEIGDCTWPLTALTKFEIISLPGFVFGVMKTLRSCRIHVLTELQNK